MQPLLELPDVLQHVHGPVLGVLDLCGEVEGDGGEGVLNHGGGEMKGGPAGSQDCSSSFMVVKIGGGPAIMLSVA